MVIYLLIWIFYGLCASTCFAGFLYSPFHSTADTQGFSPSGHRTGLTMPVFSSLVPLTLPSRAARSFSFGSIAETVPNPDTVHFQFPSVYKTILNMSINRMFHILSYQQRKKNKAASKTYYTWKIFLSENSNKVTRNKTSTVLLFASWAMREIILIRILEKAWD